MNAPYSLDVMIAELVSQGFGVSFTEGFGAEPFGAHVEKSGDPNAGCTALGYTARDALAAALPETVEESLTALAPQLPAPTVETDVRTLSADMDDVMQRLDALEGESVRTERALVHVIVQLLVDQNPDGELARLVRKDREKTAAENPG